MRQQTIRLIATRVVVDPKYVDAESHSDDCREISIVECATQGHIIDIGSEEYSSFPLAFEKKVVQHSDEGPTKQCSKDQVPEPQGWREPATPWLLLPSKEGGELAEHVS